MSDVSAPRLPFKIGELLILGFIFFNSVLCASLGAGIPVTGTTVAAAQGALFLAFVSAILFLGRIRPVDLAVALCLALSAGYALALGKVESVRVLFDVLVVPVALLFGFRIRVNVWLVIRVAFFANFVFALLEWFFPSAFLDLLPVGRYYFETRSWVAEGAPEFDFSGFYIGAERAGGGYFTDGHRLASLMLDPLTLGYLMVMVASAAHIFCSSKVKRIFYYMGALLLIVLSDSRVALLLLLLIPLLNMRWVLRLPLLYSFAGFWLCAFVLWYTMGPLLGEFNYRLSLTFNAVSLNSFDSLIGLSEFAGKANDSGYVYFLNVLGLPVCLLAVWYLDGFRKLAKKAESAGGVVVFAFFLAFTMFFGAAALSAKVAIVWGVLVGSLASDGFRRRSSDLESRRAQ
jgi:hypothetical protein